MTTKFTLKKNAITNTLQYLRPDLVRDWHPTKNKDMNPSNYSCGSNFKAWWICKNKHEWSASIKTRNTGSGCPYCSNKKAGKENCLAVINPLLATEWDFPKNGLLAPENVTAGSDKIVWWKCQHNHSWQARIKDRNRGRGCPFCSGKRAFDKHNFAQTFPELLKEWHLNNTFSASTVTPKSSKKAWWICENGHEWQERIAARANGYGCPYCANKRVSKENSLTNNTLLIDEWDYSKNKDLLPGQFTLNSKKKIWWLCKRQHSWAATIRYRNNGGGCPSCKSKSSIMELAIYAELKILFTNVEHRAKVNGVELDIFIPDLRLGIEYDGSYWHKNKNLQDRQKNIILNANKIDIIRIRDHGLAKIGEHDLIIAKYKSIPDAHSLYTIIKSLIEQISLLKGQNSLNKKALAFLENNNFHFDFKKIMNLLPEYKKTLSLEVCNNNLSLEWHPNKNNGLSPSDVNVNSKISVWWMCKKGHEWQEQIKNRNQGSRKKGYGCPYCSSHRVSLENSLSNNNVKLSSEWNTERNSPLTPAMVTVNSNKKVWWKCSKGHEWHAAITNRNHLGSGCPYCTGKRASPEYNLEIKFPEIAREWNLIKNNYKKASDFTHGSTYKAWWICSKGHEWEATITQRTRNNNRCPFCKNALDKGHKITRHL